MKKTETFPVILAALLIGGSAISSCKKEEPAIPPTTRTVLTSIVGADVPIYGNTLETFQYDEDYRLVRTEYTNPFLEQQASVYDITYSDGSILVDGISHGHSSKYVCSLDAEGRIVEVERTDVIENETLVRHSSYTYDADGHLVNDYHISDPEGEGASSVYIWEGDELREIRTTEGSMVVLFETSNAPAEACFEVFSFSSTLTFLWMQGFYGRAPAHLPSKKTDQYFISGIPILNVPMEYKATLDGNGHLATLEHICEAHGEDDKYVLIWEEK